MSEAASVSPRSGSAADAALPERDRPPTACTPNADDLQSTSVYEKGSEPMRTIARAAIAAIRRRYWQAVERENERRITLEPPDTHTL